MKGLFKYLHLLAIAFAISATCVAQAPAWRQSAGWTLYNVRGAKFYKVALDSLGKYDKRPLSDDTMRRFLSQASQMPSDKAPIWMGAYVSSCLVDHKTRKIDISSYGGFFFDETDKKYYSVPQELQNEWLNYLADCAGALSPQ